MQCFKPQVADINRIYDGVETETRKISGKISDLRFSSQTLRFPSFPFPTPQRRLLLYTGCNGFSGQFFRIFQIIIFCFVADICDLVHDVEAIRGLI